MFDHMGRGELFYLKFSQLGEKVVEEASFGLSYLTINNGLRNRVS